MKTIFPLLCLCVLFSASRAASAGDAPVPGIPSAITAVAVYGDRAVVTRSAELDLAAGTREIAFERLPAALVDQSLQVSGQGTAEATILDVTARQTFVEATIDERVKALEDEILGLQKQTRVNSDRSTALNEQRDFVKRMLIASTSATPAQPGSTAAVRPSLDEWQKLYAYSEDAFGKIAAELQSIGSQQDVLNAKKAALDRQLAELRGSPGKSYKTVVVRVSAAKSGNLQLALAYTVPNASWTPAYDVRLHSNERTVELSYFGVVRQNTGEDWNNVALTLSTARPSLGGGAPELPAWVLNVARPVPAASGDVVKMLPFEVKGSAVTGFATNSVGSGSRMKLDLRDVPVAYSTADVDSGATSATFRIAAPASLKSDASAQKVAIMTTSFAAALQYQSTPKLREAAFLNATATNSSDYPILAGAMNTFLDNVFVASSSLKTVMSGEKFDLALGADEGIGIKRKLVNRFTEDTGLVSKGKRVTYEFLVTVTNNKKTAEKVVFKEPIPVSRDEKIVVKLLTPSDSAIGTPDKPKEIIRETDGILAWHLDLKPGEKRDVTVKFSVDYPAELNVSGLE